MLFAFLRLFTMLPVTWLALMAQAEPARHVMGEALLEEAMREAKSAMTVMSA